MSAFRIEACYQHICHLYVCIEFRQVFLACLVVDNLSVFQPERNVYFYSFYNLTTICFELRNFSPFQISVLVRCQIQTVFSVLQVIG